MDQLLTVAEVASRLRLSQATVRRRAAEFGGFKVRGRGSWRFPAAEVELLASSPPSTPSLEARLAVLEAKLQ